METSFQLEEWLVDPRHGQIVGPSGPVRLEPRVMRVLLCLAERRGEIVSRDELIREVWGGTAVTDEVLTQSVSELRKALGEEVKEPRFIQTIPKQGYRLIAAVVPKGAAEAGAERLVPEPVEPNATHTAFGRVRKRRDRIAWVLSAAVLALAVILGGGYSLLVRDERPAVRQVSLTQLTTDPGVEDQPRLSPDGKMLVYVGWVPGQSEPRLNRRWTPWAAGQAHIYLLRVGGKNAMHLTKDSSDDNWQPAFSPDGERIAFRSERDGGGIFVMGATGESVNRLTDFGYNPAWSPDGSEIVCATKWGDFPYSFPGESQLWRINVATGEKRQVSEENAVQPSWSPHGHRIAYWAVPKGGGQRDIWTISPGSAGSAGGGTPVAVTSDAALDWNPVWSPDGRWLYFGSDRGGSMNLWRVEIDEVSGKVLGTPEPLTAAGAGFRGPMSVSADGLRIAYTERTDTLNIERIGFDPEKTAVAGAPEPVTRGTLQVMLIDSSPDGKWLAFNSFGKQDDIYVVRTDGTALRQLTNDPAKDRGPRWSPDGKQIAFFSDRGGKYEAWVVGADGTGLRQLTTTTGTFNELAWSPDGSRLSFNDITTSSYIVDLSKGTSAVPEVLPAPNGAGAAFSAYAWSSDGSRIAGHLTRPDSVRAGIVTYSIEKRAFEQLTETGERPRWLSDGYRLIYRDDTGSLSLVESPSKRVHELLSLRPDTIWFPVPSPDDRWIYFVRHRVEADLWLVTLQ